MVFVVPAFAADDPLQVVNNLSDFILSLIRAIGLILLGLSVLLIMLGGVIGMGIAAAIIPGVSAASGGMISLPTVQWQTWLTGLALMLGIGLVVGALPAMRAMRLKIVDALAGR